MSIKELVAGGVITLVIGGATYTVSQTDIASNFANDTGVSQQQAEDYVAGIDEKDLVPYDELGDDFISDGNETLKNATSIDCINYEYDWESPSLPCSLGKSQLIKFGNDAVSLGRAYKVLSTNSASKPDISRTIHSIDTFNKDYDMEIVRKIYTPSQIDEDKKTHSYNKATLQAAIQSDE
jgi:hypothetical protein